MTWAKVKESLKRVAQTLLGPVGAVVVVVVAVFLVCLGVKGLQIGGILGALLGKSPTKKALDAANSIPEDRIGADGKLIPLGQADAKGITQVAVVPIQDAGLFGDPKSVQFEDPVTSETIDVALPVGVTSKDVEHVVVVQPGTFAVTVKNNSRVTAQDIDALLAKYDL